MSSAYMWSVSPPPNLPAKLRRKSSSASINAPPLSEPDDNDLDSPSPVTSPLPSSSPPSTPINHIATRYSHSRSKFQISHRESHPEFDDAPGSPTLFYRRGRTSKYMSHQLVSEYESYPDSEDEITVNSEPYRSDDLLAWLCPPSPARDVREVGCDSESMDIHLRRTYFATSSERGRWQSSPVMPRTYNAKSFTSSPIRPLRGHSTPVKSVTRDVKSPLLEFRDFVRRQSTSGVKEDPPSSPFLAASDSNDIEDYRSLSPLPPSSPPTSPLSLAPSQPDDCALNDDDMILDDNCNSDDLDPKQQNIHSANVTPREVSSSDSEALLLASEHALNAASTACPSSCTNEATHQPLKLSLTVPASINTITSTSTTEIEPSRSYPHSPTNTLLGLSAYTNIPSAVTPPPHLSKEEMGLAARNTTSTGVVGVRMIVDAQVGQCDSATSQSMQIRVSSVAAVSPGTNPVDLPPTTSAAIPHSPLKTVKKPRLSFSDGEFVQGSSVSQPQPQTARRSSMSRPKSPDKDTGATKESSRPRPEPKLKQGLKREDSISSVAPAQKKPRLSEDVDRDTDQGPRRKQRPHKTSSSAKEKITVDKSRSRSRSCLKSKPSEEDLRTQVARICDEPRLRNGSEPSTTKAESSSTAPAPLDPEQVELTGMLVEALATSRASSMDPLALHTAITQTHPHLKTKHNKKEWLNLIPAMLEAGRERCGMFEKVQSSGTDGAKQARWFYVSERDEDRERAELLEELMPKQKRNETKKFKKYYYAPLQKVSRWESEDAI